MINFKNEAIGLLCICHKLTYKHPEPQTATCKLYVMINFNSTFYIEFEIPSHINNFHFVLSSNKHLCPENSDTSKHLELFYNHLMFDIWLFDDHIQELQLPVIKLRVDHFNSQ